jgi:hypothetical protein
VGLGTAAVAGGATVASGLDALGKHDTFVNDNCAKVGSPSCNTLGTAGSSAETRTNVLLGVTAALGVATIVSLVFTRWGSRDGHAHVRVGPRVGVLEF